MRSISWLFWKLLFFFGFALKTFALRNFGRPSRNLASKAFFFWLWKLLPELRQVHAIWLITNSHLGRQLVCNHFALFFLGSWPFSTLVKLFLAGGTTDMEPQDMILLVRTNLSRLEVLMDSWQLRSMVAKRHLPLLQKVWTKCLDETDVLQFSQG